MLLAENERLLRDSLAKGFHLAGLEVATSSLSPRDVAAAAVEFTPDVIVCSVPCVDRAVLDLLVTLKESSVPGGVLLVAGKADAAAARHVLRAGAVGYVQRGLGFSQLLLAVRTVASGHSLFPTEFMAQLLGRGAGRGHWQDPHLTGRQRRVLGAMSQGLGDWEIARALGLSESTVKSEVKSILRKTGARNRVEAVATALNRHLIS